MKTFNLLLFFFLIIVQLIIYANGRECKSIIIVSDLENFKRLNNCTVIKGSLKIALIREHRNDMELFNNMSFPLLREITEFFFLYMVEGLKSLSKLFPNLIVIRGRKLNLRYAFAVNECPHLEELGLKSLMLIQRGQVFIDRNEKLCYTDKVEWRNVTKYPERNHIQHNTEHPELCPACPAGCNTCYGRTTCQRYDLENLVVPTYFACHPECLGGCWPDKRCVTCRSFREGLKCVFRCSPGRLVSFDDMRCYTDDECINERKIIFKSDGKFECVSQCPPGFAKEYTVNGQKYSLKNCAKCHILDKTCGKKICRGDRIHYLEHLEHYKDCVKINGSLTINLRDETTTANLYPYLSAIEEISDYLHVFASDHITSLKFFTNLKLIRGRKLNNNFALLVHHNKNLTELWDWKNKKENLTLLRGGFHANSNYKLCNHILRQAEEYITVARIKEPLPSHLPHDVNDIHYNDDEVLCGQPSGVIDYKVLSHNTVSINWPKDLIYFNLELLWREFDKDYNFTIQNDIDEDVCLRNSWNRVNMPIDREVTSDNKMFVNYNLTNLKPSTIYGLIIKTFNNYRRFSDYKEQQSHICYIKTEPDLEPPPKINISSNDPHKIELNWENYIYKSDFQNLLIEVFTDPDNAKLLQTRDYMNSDYPLYTTDQRGTILSGNNIPECSRKEFEELEEDDEFYDAIKDELFCNLDTSEKCESEIPQLSDNSKDDSIMHTQIFFNTHANKEKKSLTIDKLKHYTNYVIKVSSCHKKICGMYYLDTIRTLAIESKDAVTDVNITSGWNHYYYYVTFTPPKDPNGVVVYYSVEVAKYEDDHNTEDYSIYPNELEKVMENGIKITTTPNCVFRIKVFSLGAFTTTPWHKVPPFSSRLTFVIVVVILVLVSLVVVGIFIYRNRSIIARFFRPPVEEQRVIFTAEDQNILIPTNEESVSVDDGRRERASRRRVPLNRPSESLYQPIEPLILSHEPLLRSEEPVIRSPISVIPSSETLMRSTRTSKRYSTLSRPSESLYEPRESLFQPSDPLMRSEEPSNPPRKSLYESSELLQQPSELLHQPSEPLNQPDEPQNASDEPSGKRIRKTRF